MKRSTKAVLLSALVFPGAGHLYLKKYLPGAGLLVVSFIAIYYLVSIAVERAVQIAEKIQAGNVPLDVDGIAALVSSQASTAETQLLNIATAALIVCWLIGIIDALRVGRLQDKTTDAD